MEDVAPFLWVTVSVIRPLWLIQISFGPLSFEILIADFVSKNRSKGRRSTRLFIPHTPYKKFSTPMSSSTPSGTTSRKGRAHPYAHAVRRRRLEYENEVALGSTLPPPRVAPVVIAQKVSPLDSIIYVLIIASILIRILNIILIKEIIANASA
ncbi:hypothetical protein F5880DRAFT_1595056 [Lentinula raphanica]|nr:hypothetical protein F5880DRAFT_1595056 [Lentinula raphanica]